VGPQERYQWRKPAKHKIGILEKAAENQLSQTATSKSFYAGSIK
jgi:hypothetical protein